MKPPEEIKADAATCITMPPNAVCNRLELYKDCGGDCRYVIKELYDLVMHYEFRLAQVERERDAAVLCLMEAAKDGAVCTGCRHDLGIDGKCEEADFDCKQCKIPCMCKTCDANFNYQWRGVCDDDTGDEA